MESQKEEDWTENLNDVVLSVAIVIFVCCLGLFARVILRSRRMTAISKRVILEFITTAEAAVLAFEVNYIIWDNFPVWIYIVFILAFTLYQTWPTRQNQRADGNPVETLIAFLKGQHRFEMAVIFMLSQVFGAIVSYILIIKPLWSNADWWTWWTDEQHNIHTKVISQKVWPTSVIQDDVNLSILSEAMVTFLMYLIQVYVRSLHMRPWETRLSTIFINTLVYSAGAPYSGAFYNPAVATGLELVLTSGANLSTKIWVYWVAPFVGIVLALFLERIIT